MTQVQRLAGLSLVEVLVAILMLSVVAGAVLASFTMMARINRDSATDVDYLRTVRSATERIKLEWSDPDLFENERIGTIDGLTVDAYVKSVLGSSCAASVADDPVIPGIVKLVRISCEAAGGLGGQSFEVEYGRP